MKKKSTVIKNIFSVIGMLFLLFLICGIIFSIFYIFTLQEWQTVDVSVIPKRNQTLFIYDKNQNEITTLSLGEDRTETDIDSLSDNTINAFLAAEDLRFFEHSGVDIIRIFGAFVSDLKSGSIKEGASTITQQLVKTLYLKNDQVLSRKVQEALIALKFEKQYSKKEILEMYLNTVYFGNGAYGIENASQRYFGKSAGELTLSEAATLAGILKAPSTYAPHIDMEASKYRRDTIINNMADAGMITEKQRKDAINKEITLVKNEDDSYPYGYFLDMVLSESEDILSVSSEELLSNGYKIYTTLDTEMQSAAEEIYKNSDNFPQDADDGTKVESALVVLDNSSGAISAIIGGREHTAQRILNRATMTRRNPGSTIKPLLVYAPAIESLKYTTTTFILDEQESFNGYTPSNAGDTYNGWVTLRTALSKSLNLPAIRILNDIGTDYAMNFASRFGIVFSEEDGGLTLALGGFTNGITPLEMASAYSVLGNQGRRNTSYCIEKIVDSDGNTVYSHEKKEYQAVSSATAFILSDVLKTCAKEGTAKNVYTEGIEIAAKTGTASYNNTENNQDAWIAAYNPDYTICCWMGFDNTDENHTLSQEESGGNYPAKIAKALFENIYSGKTAPEFQKPRTVITKKLDAYMLENCNIVLPISSLDNSENAVTEYYIAGTQPVNY